MEAFNWSLFLSWPGALHSIEHQMVLNTSWFTSPCVSKHEVGPWSEHLKANWSFNQAVIC